ncbi:homocysteine S-methyltransferase 3-like [Eurytemora carolleeae]|uniref:homocysteine S-methyltransferase 3-like n=1 Tax=Eurytemora carolleeae TaxID=1294199 RepID=UPI000C763451|nr:homocysteine S-methyltransferase 3-like [Eurytemora carolleeae]|eukprot:XP_023334832.1 homocysteine S-methyltransferase 3-like [Eurytemora affinis]
MDNLNYSSPLVKGDLWIIDGGFSTQLMVYMEGLDNDPLWTARSIVTNPDLVEQVHMDFINAGANVILTCSYQISEQGFKQHLNMNSKATVEAVRTSVQLAKSAIKKCEKRAILIGGSVGPYGACQSDGSEYTGAYLDALSREELVKWHLPRIQTLISSRVDFIAAETLPSWREAIAILDCISATGGTTPVWVSFTLKNENNLPTGETIQDAMRQLRKHELFDKGRIFAVGFNCLHPKLVSGGIDNIRKVAKTIPIVVYPNSGEDWDGIARCWKGEGGIDWSDYVGDWLKKGVVGLGGCCRLGAEHIADLRLSVAKVLLNQI